jgi:hypothetical protein
MQTAIDITNRFPPTRERTVLLELFRVVRNLQTAGIETVICGGWVPFLKQLARESETAHSMSLDIDLLFRQAARERDAIDRIRTLLVGNMEFERSRTHSFRYEKTVEGNAVQLDLLVDLPRTDNDEPVRRIQGISSSLDLCLVDGAEDLAGHVETIRLRWLEDGQENVCDITVPNPVGFLMLKAEVCRYRETTKDPYDIYCRVGGGAPCCRASHRPPPKLHVRFSRMQLSRRLNESRMQEKESIRPGSQAHTSRKAWRSVAVSNHSYASA